MKFICPVAASLISFRRMERGSIVEDILSDEYEEGEILDDDIIFYENVSSLEEFSDGEIEKKPNGSRCLKSDSKKVKTKRKKEHRCKEESICRKERSGKHCYARIRKRRVNLDSKSKNSSCKVVKPSENDRRLRALGSARIPSVVRGNDKSDRFNGLNMKSRLKPNRRSKRPLYYSQYNARNNAFNRIKHDRLGKIRQLSSDDNRKKKPLTPNTPVPAKVLHETNRIVAKSSLLDRLVKAGSLTHKPSDEGEDNLTKPPDVENNSEEQPMISPDIEPDAGPDISVEDLLVNKKKTLEDSKVHSNVNDGSNKCVDEPLCITLDISPADIPIPPYPKAPSPLPEPKKEEIDELHLRLIALKTAIMKKHTDLKRKKRLAASNRSSKAVNDSFKDLVLMDMGSSFDETDSIPTPPPPGTDSWPVNDVPLRDLDDPHWSDEDMVIDQESICNDTIIEANVPTYELSVAPHNQFPLPSHFSPSSQSQLPCCKGNPIPVVSPHRPAKEIDERRGVLPSTNSIISVPCTAKQVKTPSPKNAETPKYLKEINYNQRRSLKRKRSTKRLRPRRNMTRQKTPIAPVRRLDRPSLSKDVVKRAKCTEADDDEDELRKLALMSVKPKSTVTTDLNILSADIVPAPIEIKPEPEMKITATTEPWEDLDEDILRAQLLSSLSRKIPEGPSAPPSPPLSTSMPAPSKRFVKPVRKEVLTKKINKENVYTKRNTVAKTVRKNPKKFVKSALPQINPPVVHKFIIKVSDSDTSEDELMKSVQSEASVNLAETEEQKVIESSIDKLLEEARKETELIQKASAFYPIYEVPKEPLHPEDLKQESDMLPCEDALSQNIGVPEPAHESDTLSSLPLWQLEEFERQKRTMTLKGSVIEATKKRIRQEIGIECHAIKNSKGADFESPTTILLTNAVGTTEEKTDVDSACNPDTQPAVESTNTVCCVADSSTDDAHLVGLSKSVEEEVKALLDELLSDVSTDSSNVRALVTNTNNATNLAVLSTNSIIKKEVVIDDKIKYTHGSNVPLIKSVDSKVLLKEPALNPTKIVRLNTKPSTVTNRQPIKIESIKKSAPAQILRKSLTPNSKTLGLTGAIQKKPLLEPGILRKTESFPHRTLHKKIVINPTQTVHSISSALSYKANDVKKPVYHLKDSSYTLKALNEMTEIVTEFEGSISTYKNLRKDYINLRRQLAITQQKMTTRKKKLLEMRDTIENKKRLLQSTITMDTSSLSPLPDSREQPKQTSRAAELLSLKFKEVCLRAQFAMMNLENGVKATTPLVTSLKMLRPAEGVVASPRKKSKLKPKLAISDRLIQEGKSTNPEVKRIPSSVGPPNSSVPQKLVITASNKDELDPLIPLCPYDNKGVCKDEECKYQHLRFE